MEEFKKDNLSAEDSFWVMWYFLQDHYELSGGSFDLSDILSATEPVEREDTSIKLPTDSSMISYWNDAIEKFKLNGIPSNKVLTK